MGLRGHHKAAIAAVQTVRLLVVRLGKSLYALPSEPVRGVLTRDEAGSAHTVTAVGVTYQDVDLAGRLETTLDHTHPDTRTVLYSNGQTRGAIRVEEVIGMVEVEPGQCRSLPPQFQREERTWISGTTFFQNQLALILNPEWVLGELGEEVATGAGSCRGEAVSHSVVSGEAC